LIATVSLVGLGGFWYGKYSAASSRALSEVPSDESSWKSLLDEARTMAQSYHVDDYEAKDLPAGKTAEEEVLRLVNLGLSAERTFSSSAKEHFDAAEEAAAKAFKAAPGDLQRTRLLVEARQQAGGYWRRQGHLSKARDILSSALELVSGLQVEDMDAPMINSVAEAHRQLANTLREIGELEMAKDNYLKGMQLLSMGQVTKKIQIETNWMAIHADFAEWLHDEGRLEDARHMLKTAMRIDDQLPKFEEEHRHFAHVITRLAAAEHDDGRIGRAFPQYLKAIRLFQDGASWDGEVIIALQNLAMAERDAGDVHGALATIDKTMELQRSRATKEKEMSPRMKVMMGHSLSLGAEIMRGEGKENKRKALEWALKALNLQMGSLEKDQPVTPEIADTMNTVGNIFNDLRLLSDATKYYEQAMVADRRMFGESSFQVATGYNNLGSVAHRKKDFKTAEENYRKSLAIHEKLLGPDNSAVALCYSNLAVLLYDDDHLEDSLKMAEEAVTRARASGLPENNKDLKLYVDHLGKIQQVVNEKQDEKKESAKEEAPKATSAIY